MYGMTAEKVASSWIEALGGESMCSIFSTPPDFWARTGLLTRMKAAAVARPRHRVGLFIVSSLARLAAKIPALKVDQFVANTGPLERRCSTRQWLDPGGQRANDRS